MISELARRALTTPPETGVVREEKAVFGVRPFASRDRLVRNDQVDKLREDDLYQRHHVSHEPAIAWFARHAKEGWASCPPTRNGCVRSMSSPSCAKARPVQALVRRLAEAWGGIMELPATVRLSLLNFNYLQIGQCWAASTAVANKRKFADWQAFDARRKGW